MKKLILASAIILLNFAWVQAQEELDDIFNEIDFDETKSNLEEVDVNEFVRDITDDLLAIDEMFSEDSMLRAEAYYNERTMYLQELVNKPATECYDKNSLNSLKSATFSKISTGVLNPFYYDLMNLADTKSEEKYIILEEVKAETDEMIAEMEKDETMVTLPLIKVVVKERIKFFEETIEDKEDVWKSSLGKMKESESKKNMAIKESLEAVEGAEFGDETCYILSRKKKGNGTASVTGTDSSSSVD
jgi:hypothetical protein